MTETELYQIYSRWTGELHFWCVRELNAHLDCEYFPDTFEFKVYSGYAEEYSTASGIPGLSRPPGERSETIKLLRPEQNPNKVDLENLFKSICLAAARVLGVRLERKALETGEGRTHDQDPAQRRLERNVERPLLP